MHKTFYKPLGFLFLVLASVGVILPVLPATPFLLLSAWFFARSSARWHRWLLNTQIFGPLIRDWEERRCITWRTRAVALAGIYFAGGASVILVLEDWRWRLACLVLMGLGCAMVLSLDTCPCGEKID